MKPKRRRLSQNELFIVFVPFPILWLWLGLFIDSSIFRFWVLGQSIHGSQALIIGFTSIFFTIFYPLAILMCYGTGKPITPTQVIISAVTVAFLGYALSPVT